MRIRRIYNLSKVIPEKDKNYMFVFFMCSQAINQQPIPYSWITEFKKIEKQYKVPFDRKLFLEELYDKTIGYIIFRVNLWWMFHKPFQKKYDLSGTSHWE